MSEGEVQRLSEAIKALSEKTDRQHKDNQDRASKDRETFAHAMNKQRELFQEALNKQFLEHVELARSVSEGNALLKVCVGTGQPGEGRVGALEGTVETLKKFRWQSLAAIMTFLYLLDKVAPLVKH